MKAKVFYTTRKPHVATLSEEKPWAVACIPCELNGLPTLEGEEVEVLVDEDLASQPWVQKVEAPRFTQGPFVLNQDTVVVQVLAYPRALVWLADELPQLLSSLKLISQAGG